MEKTTPEMPRHVAMTYRDAVDNIIFNKKQQWVTTNYAILIYAAIFVVSANFFSRNDMCVDCLVCLLFLPFCIICTCLSSSKMPLQPSGRGSLGSMEHTLREMSRLA
jgi:hypothetical protein